MNQGRKEIAKLLASKSADISLHTAAYIGDLQRVEKFINGGANVDAKDREGQTALHYAAKAGQIAVAKLLIANGADVNAGDDWTPLVEAAYCSKEMVELLLAKGADINTGKWTPLHGAVYGHNDIVELLIAKGANVNARDGFGRTPLFYAQYQGRTKIVELLRKHGAKE